MRRASVDPPMAPVRRTGRIGPCRRLRWLGDRICRWGKPGGDDDRSDSRPRWEERATHTAQTLGRTWSAAQPMLFGLIGAAVALDTVEPSYVRGGLAVVTVGLLVRLLVTYFSVSAKRFTTGERLFVAMAWIPKATVQAAIGALALDLARQNNAGQQAENYGTQVVTVAVLAILLTAPLGAIGIAWSGPRWLQRGEPTRRG